MKKQLFILAILTALAIGCLVVLGAMSGAPGQGKHGFNRVLKNDQATLLNQIEIGVNATNIAGVSGDTIFLGHTSPGTITGLIVSDGRTFHQNVDIKDMDSTDKAFFTIVDYPDLYIVWRNKKVMLRGRLVDGQTEKVNLGFGPIRQPTLINNYTMVMRVMDTVNLNSLFRKYDIGSNVIVKTETDLTERFGDAGFANDGIVSYDRDAAKLYHVHRHTNHITSIDTNLVLQSRSHTIDTFATYVKTRKGERSVTNKEPVKSINLHCDAYDGKLFVLSNVIADNEDNKVFNSNNVIDVYEDDNYLYSIYLPYVAGKRLLDFRVCELGVVTLFDNRIMIYGLTSII